MAMSIAVRKTLTMGGKTVSVNTIVEANAAAVEEITVPHGWTGELTTRTNNTDGTITMDDSAHGIQSGDRLDLYWDGGMRRGVEAGSPSGAAIPISSGAGDNLPTQGTEITVVLPVEFPIILDGDLLQGFMAGIAKAGQIVVCENDDTELLNIPLGEASSYEWFLDQGPANPLASADIAKVYISHGDAADAVAKVGFLFNNA